MFFLLQRRGLSGKAVEAASRVGMMALNQVRSNLGKFFWTNKIATRS